MDTGLLQIPPELIPWDTRLHMTTRQSKNMKTIKRSDLCEKNHFFVNFLSCRKRNKKNPSSSLNKDEDAEGYTIPRSSTSNTNTPDLDGIMPAVYEAGDSPSVSSTEIYEDTDFTGDDGNNPVTEYDVRPDPEPTIDHSQTGQQPIQSPTTEYYSTSDWWSTMSSSHHWVPIRVIFVILLWCFWEGNRKSSSCDL